MQKSAIQKRIEAQLAAPSHTREDSNVNDKKPVPPSLAQFALEQLSMSDLRIDTFHAHEQSGFVHSNQTAVRVTHLPTGAYVESKDERSLHKNKQRCMELLPAAIEAKLGARSPNRAEELITQLEAEIVKRDARIAELEAEAETTGVHCTGHVDYAPARASECEHKRQHWNLQGGGHCDDCGAPVGTSVAPPASADAVSVSVPVPRELSSIAIELCDVIENKAELPLNKWALKSAYLIGKVRAIIAQQGKAVGDE